MNTAGSILALGVIPARMGSTRFPGKSLALLHGKPLIQWVVERALLATRLERVLVATDDARIAQVAEAAGVEAVMTRPDHPSGTDRIAEAAAGRDHPLIINIQGDEPLIEPELIDRLVEGLAEDNWDMITAATPLRDPALVVSPSVVKVVTAQNGQALYFSRSVIPHFRDKSIPEAMGEGLYFRHLGLYGYRREFLLRMIAEPPSALEEAEKLEQLRALQMGCRMRVLTVDSPGPGVDHPEDVPVVEALMTQGGLV